MNQLISKNQTSTIEISHDEENISVRKTRKKKNVRRRKLIFLVIVLLIVVLIGVNLSIFLNRKSSKGNGKKLLKKVLFVIGDGIPADVIESSSIEYLKKIGQYRRAYVGGENGSYSDTWTISAPGYMSLLTGTWGNKHNVYDNDVENPNYNYKNIFRLLKENQPAKKIGIFSTWIDNRLKLIGEGLKNAGEFYFDYAFDGYELNQTLYPHDSEHFYIHQIDERVVNDSCSTVSQFAPDLSWVYLQYTDDVGHEFGDGEQFQQALIYFDRQIQRIWETIQYRQKYFLEDWLFLVTTDHGRDSVSGHDHGNQSERERTTWMVVNHQQMNDYFHQYQPAIVDILPTITRFMNIKVPLQIEREFDGIPLIGDVSLIQPEIFLTLNQLTVKWKAINPAGEVKIFLTTTNSFQNGTDDDYTLLGTAPVNQQTCAFNIEKYPSQFYKLVLQGEYNTVNRWIYRS